MPQNSTNQPTNQPTNQTFKYKPLNTDNYPIEVVGTREDIYSSPLSMVLY